MIDFPRIRFPLSLLAVAAGLALSPAAPQAQTQMQAQAGAAFQPAGPWRVEPSNLAALRGLGELKLPCMMAGEYDNGFILRMAGGGGQIQTLAIDTRQNAFETGRRYPVTLSIGQSYQSQAQALAFTPGILLMNLREVTGFYGAVRGAQTLQVALGPNRMRFDLGQIRSALEELESCHGREGAAMPASRQPAPAAQDTPRSPQRSADQADPFGGVNMAFDTGSDMSARQPRTMGDIIGDAAGTGAVDQGGNVSSGARWTARAGEDVQAVLRRWADRAGYDLDWQAAPAGQIADDIRITGSFEDAVDYLLAQNAAASGLRAQYGAQNAATAAQQSGFGSAANAQQATWQADAGESLELVFTRWAAEAGAQARIEGAGDLTLAAPVRSNASFEAAVQAALDQFAGRRRQPDARLNIDPQDGQRTLILNERGGARGERG